MPFFDQVTRHPAETVLRALEQRFPVHKPSGPQEANLFQGKIRVPQNQMDVKTLVPMSALYRVDIIKRILPPPAHSAQEVPPNMADPLETVGQLVIIKSQCVDRRPPAKQAKHQFQTVLRGSSE